MKPVQYALPALFYWRITVIVENSTKDALRKIGPLALRVAHGRPAVYLGQVNRVDLL